MSHRRLLAWVAPVLLVACARGADEADSVAFDGSIPGGDAHVDAGPSDAPSDAPADVTSGDAAPFDAPFDANECAGKLCNAPPVSTCKDASTLLTYAPSGTCSAGVCAYAEAPVACPGGCLAGACKGDPCLGKTCNAPPTNACAGPSDLLVYDASGACSAGVCSYGSHAVHCSFGCSAGICNGDPCLGKICNAPSANYCESASSLVVYEAPGTCAAGVCGYAKHSELCSFGCDLGKCKGDPCSGVSCTTPPASYCVSATTRRAFAATGTCTAGACAYVPTDTACNCQSGKCVECVLDGDCMGGKYCNAGTCAACNTDAKCGASCTSCVGAGKVCDASGAACVACVVDGHCGAGKYCNAGACAACNTNLKCGASCVACGAATQCDGTSCAVCGTDASCGPTCGACGGTTPHCLASSASSQCVACTSDAHCASTQACNLATHACAPKCSSTLQSAFADDFATPSASAWTSGTDAAVSTSRWKAYTKTQHGVRVYNGRLEITNVRSGSPDHGQGYAYVKAGGAAASYDAAVYASTLKANAGKSVVWSFNLRRDDPEITSGGFKCSSTSSQNDVTVGLAYVLASSSAADLNASTSTCGPTGTAHGYALVLGGSAKLRLVRFDGGLRNGTLTDLVTSSSYSIASYFSARVTYDATVDKWTLETRSDGSSSFANPAAGAYGFTGSATDATYVNEALDYAGPYFQTGCTGLCSSTYTALFDNVSVGVRCAP